jgi:putative tricarboxylic transport membrane protein
LLIGFILGPMVEDNLRRAMLIFRGDFWAMVERPIAGSLLFLTVLLLIYTAYQIFFPKPKPIEEGINQ